ncbi:BlaI/MecI/CopY family transcriptional regulator [Paenibacillus sp. HJL G12]|uniref:BlaI/MecI/CopY family transcriptional regulator n=1 Tax=Paenibacillus dendrobii TaxID=2691084 RepID=A0A7X3IH28_9BACL|nr:BlaI/MecI/CopY family transcriptional regulator [Paenibacillus dendrobii]MWV43814.1 BlaI/MecI/CopY family transcriptional regulator [Paenibacillus dendrobii]
MNKLPIISEAEWEVMKVLWQSSPMTANEVIANLASRMDWSPKTVRTLLNRLVAKEAITYHPDSKPYSYYPLITEEECQKAETKSFLKRIYSGSFKPLMVNFLKDEELSSADIEELRRLLDEKSDSTRRD